MKLARRTGCVDLISNNQRHAARTRALFQFIVAGKRRSVTKLPDGFAAGRVQSNHHVLLAAPVHRIQLAALGSDRGITIAESARPKQPRATRRPRSRKSLRIRFEITMWTAPLR